MFVINEGSRVLAQLDRMESALEHVDVIIADGGSTDGSMESGGLTSRGVSVRLVKKGPGTLGAQMRMVFDYALDGSYEGIVVMDGNNKDDPEAIPRFVGALDDGVDHVQGSRFIPGGRAVNTPLGRHLGIRLVHAPLISRTAGFKYTDTTNGFRAYSRRFLLDPRVAPFRHVFNGYELHYYLAIRAGELGFQVREIPVARAYPAEGPVPTKISPFKGNLSVLRLLFAAYNHRFDPTSVPGGR